MDDNPESEVRTRRRLTGSALSAKDRSDRRDEALIREGGRLISRLRIGKEANDALTAIMASGHDQLRSAIEFALVDTARRLRRKAPKD